LAKIAEKHQLWALEDNGGEAMHIINDTRIGF
jgi:hypothetical protein